MLFLGFYIYDVRNEILPLDLIANYLTSLFDLILLFCRARWLMPPDVPQPVRLIVLTLLWTFQLSPPVVSRVHISRGILVAKAGTMRARNGQFCRDADFHETSRDLLHAVNQRHGTHGFTSLSKEGALRIFSP
jgi:hypothetical protein